MANILITGTSSGIGLGAAVELAKRGERVFASMRDPSRAGPLLEAAAAADAAVGVVQLDVTDRQSVRRAVNDVVKAAGSIDVLVNNAGMSALGPLEFASEEETQAVFDTNVFGPLRLIRAVLPAMRERGSGRIVNLSSGASHTRGGHRLMGLYSTSKAAMNALTENLLKELAPLGIEVVLIDGGLGTATRMVDETRERADEFDPAASPYRVVERIAQLQWPIGGPPGAPDYFEFSVRSVVDACLVADPPFIHPPEPQEALRALDAMPDEMFVRLCKADASEELYVYEGPGRAWMMNLEAAAEMGGPD